MTLKRLVLAGILGATLVSLTASGTNGWVFRIPAGEEVHLFADPGDRLMIKSSSGVSEKELALLCWLKRLLVGKFGEAGRSIPYGIDPVGNRVSFVHPESGRTIVLRVSPKELEDPAYAQDPTPDGGNLDVKERPHK